MKYFEACLVLFATLCFALILNGEIFIKKSEIQETNINSLKKEF